MDEITHSTLSLFEWLLSVLPFLGRKAFLYIVHAHDNYTVIGSSNKSKLRIKLIFAVDGVFSKLAVYAISIVFMGKSVNQCVK